ncbi:MAG: hypothetical protein D4R38_00570, partial [Dehalococcoidia bacterium]
MKVIFSGFLTLVLALAITMPAAAPALADSSDDTKPQLSSLASLMIKAPNMVDVGQPATITVFSKRGHETIAGASVYALKTSDLVITADAANYTALLGEYEALAEAKGTLFGTTGSDGTFKGIFTETGRFMLVATRDGYIPGFSRLTVTLAARTGLNIKAPGSVEINKAATISVTERYTGQPVAKAAIYGRLITALNLPPVTTAPPAKLVQPQVIASSSATASVSQPQLLSATATAAATVIKADPSVSTADVQLATEVSMSGILLGYTDANGQVIYVFAEGGYYLLTALKENYAPGFAKISITIADQKKLSIKAPGSAEVGASVTFLVIDRSDGQGIAGAALWALRTEDMTGTAEPVWQSLVAGFAQNEVIEKYKSLAKGSGILLGYSGDSGQVVYTFKDNGRYVLVAIKDGYAPGFSQVKVTLSGQKQLGVRAPASAAAGQQVTIKAVEDNGGQPVEKAAIYAFSPGIIMPPTVQQAPAPADNGTATAAAIDSALSPVTSAEAQILINKNRDRSFLIGHTNSSGEVQFTFKDPGLYVLVAVKDDYLPGGTKINIKGIQPAKALEINALFNVSAGQPVNIRVWEKGTNQPVAKAAVYVLKISDSGVINVIPPTANNGKAQNGKGSIIAEVKAVPPTSNSDKAQGEANRAREKGAFVGYTDDNGQVPFIFSSSGQYILAAFKDGYSPAFSYITYTLPVSKKSLYLKAPAEANAGDAVNIGTYDAGGNALGKVGIYSLRMEFIAQAAAILQSATAVDAAAREKYGPILRERSSFIGYTDDNGQLAVKFSNSGAFMLLATRDGYLPDFAKINIRLAPTPTPVPLPIPVPQSTTTTTT